mgnify:CR=1 FL=1
MNDSLNIDTETNWELAAFVGENRAYYLEKWESLKNGSVLSFNFYAFLFGIAWLLYRKMYREAGILFAIILVESEVTFNLVGDNGAVDIAIRIFYSLAIGFTANYFYLKHAEREIQKLNEQFQDPTALKELIIKKGGTSWISVIVGIAIIVGLSLLLAYLLGDLNF